MMEKAEGRGKGEGVLLFVVIWIGAFATLGGALVLLSLYFRILGTDLSLNSMPKELTLALTASAVQAVAVWFVLPFLQGVPPSANSSRALLLIPGLVSLLLYKLAHLADWDQYESPGLCSFQFALLLIGGLFVTGDFGLGTFVLSGFATALLLIGAIARRA